VTDYRNIADEINAASNIKFDCSPQDLRVIEQIAVRFYEMARQFGSVVDVHTLQMDIATCHCNGMPLLLWQLLAAPSSDFASDVSGIARNINRRDGKLMNGFNPRFALLASPRCS